MSRVMTAQQWIDLLNEWHINHNPINSNWANHNRAGHGDFGDMHGIVVHHTGSNGKTLDQNSLLWNGIGGSNPLPGPLCHAGIAVDGTVELCGWGRANHAGLGDSAILNHVIQEDYDGTKTLRPSKADRDGNAVFYGFEIQYDGNTPMSDAQRQTIVRVCAAICTWHKWTEKSVIGHGEWQPGKWDPGAHGKLIDMGAFRTQVKQAIKEGPKGPISKPPVSKPPAPAPKPVPVPTNAVTVEKGDTLMSIAREKLGSEGRWIDLVYANPSLVRALHIGEHLTLPKK